jgi:hypothetical protein
MAEEAATAVGGAGDRLERRNYSLFLTFGVASSMGNQLVNPAVVLPFLYLALDAPVFVAALILPFIKFSGLTAELVVSPFLQKPAKTWVAAPTLLSAVALAVIAVAAEGSPPFVVVAIFIIIAVVFGFCAGISSIGYGQLFGAVIPSERRVSLSFIKTAIAGLLAAAVAVATKDYLASDQPLQRHVTVLWVGIAAMTLAAVTIVGVQLIQREEERSESEAPASPGRLRTIAGRLKEGFQTGVRYSWFRRYLNLRILLMSVTLSLPFYTIHAASVHTSTTHGLTALVVAASAGVAIGALVWHRVAAHSHRAVAMAAGCIGAAAAAFAIGLDFTGLIANVMLYAAAVFLAAFSIAGAKNGLYLYFIDMTSTDERPCLTALADTVVGVLAIAVAAALGMAAHFADPTVPLMVMLVTSLFAATYARLLIEPKRRIHLTAPDASLRPGPEGPAPHSAL